MLGERTSLQDIVISRVSYFANATARSLFETVSVLSGLAKSCECSARTRELARNQPVWNAKNIFLFEGDVKINFGGIRRLWSTPFRE